MEVLEGVEKTIFEHLRLALIDRGLLVDVTAYNTEADYIAALDALAATLESSGLSVCFVKGVTLEEFKYDKGGCYYSIENSSIDEGGIGSVGCVTYTPNNANKFDKELMPDSTVNVNITVRVVANDLKTYRLLRSILFEVLGHKRYINSITDTEMLDGQPLLLVNKGTAELQTDFKESVTMYRAMDIWPTQFQLLEANVPKLTEIDFDSEAVNNIPQ